MRLMLVATMALGVAPAATAETLKLDLTCSGQRTSYYYENTTVSVTDDKDVTKGATGQSSTLRSRVVDERLAFAFAGDLGKVRVPPAWEPTFGKRSADHWYDLTDVTVDDRFIMGRLKLGLFSKDRFRIDRTTGDIEFGGFTGACEKAEPTVRKF